jgi:hypothetical protein
MRGLRLLPILTVGLTLACFGGSALADTWYTVNDPIDPAYLTGMPLGDRSDWVQPWRAYLDTPPATALANGMGINFDVPADQAEVTAQLLAASGIKRARVEIGWSNVSYSNPTTFSNASSLEQIIGALRDNGIRPLILLNANQQIPGPMLSFTANLTSAASAGATSVQLDAATAAQVVPGYSGLNQGTQAAGIIFTSVNANGLATLSQPLPSSLAAGSYPASTLLYQPFAQPELANGAPNPQFQATLGGWLQYVRTTMNLVTSTYGSDNFDVEVWNELGNNSDFLNLGDYYNPLPTATQGDTDGAILAATAAFLHDPANGWPDVQVGDGFTNQTVPASDVESIPPGVNAIDKHPYEGLQRYPQNTEAGGTMPLDAFGLPAFTKVNGQIIDNFDPTYTAFLPEFFLTGIETETLLREIAPITTYLDGFSMGRATVPSGGGAPPAMWVTETGMDTNDLDLTPPYVVASPAEDDHVHAKAALRTYVSFIGKGIQAVDLYAVDDYPSYNLVDPAFFTAAQVGTSNNYTYPGTALGGPVMDATRRLAATLAGAQTITTPRPLSLLGISSDSDAYQFLGNGTASFPPLYDRELLYFQPFQLTSHSWVAATYVMTRNIGVDLAPENYRITIGGVDADNLTATATDPLTGNSVAVEIIDRSGEDATIQLPVTDSPEMVTLDDASPATAVALSQPTGAAGNPFAFPAKPLASSAGRASALKAASTIVRKGRAVYLRLKCTKACSVRWSLAAGRKGAGAGLHKQSLLANRATEIRVAAVSSIVHVRGGATVSLQIAAAHGKATIKRRLPVRSSLLK